MRIKNIELLETARAALQSLGDRTFFVHSDLLKGFNIGLEEFSPTNMLAAHTEALQQLLEPTSLWMPTFNYSFPKTRIYRPTDDESVVGHLTEHFRTEVAEWRLPIPMFPVSGVGERPRIDTSEPVDPWGAVSYFADLADRDGSVFFYGADLDAITYIHHIERMVGIPYRYDKVFGGVIHTDEGEQSIELKHLVRPMDHQISYHWEKLRNDLVEAGLWIDLSSKRTRLMRIPAGGLRAFWMNEVSSDPLYFLDDASRAWVEPELDRLGRGFQITDFESPDDA